MKDFLETSIYHIIGAISGVIFSILFLSLASPFFHSLQAYALSITITCFFIGLFVADSFLEFRKDKIIRENHQAHNETVAIITHEMRTTLTSTGWEIELLLRTYQNALTEEDKKMLQNSIESIHATVNHSVNLLDISLLDIGKLSLSLEWIGARDLTILIQNIVRKFNEGATTKGVTLLSELMISPSTQIQIDPLRFRIIIESLLENAIQYTLGEKKEVRLKVENDTRNLKLTFSDTGIGIPKKEQEKIFSQFFRAENARKVLTSGTGIGLHMCQEYVKAHNGTIRFESTENVGTTFFVDIPIKSSANVGEFFAKM